MAVKHLKCLLFCQMNRCVFRQFQLDEGNDGIVDDPDEFIFDRITNPALQRLLNRMRMRCALMKIWSVRLDGRNTRQEVP